MRELLFRKDLRALRLAALTVIDLVVTQTSPRFGDAHWDHLGVPHRLRPTLPVIKAVSVVALVVSAKRPALRSLTGAALVPYYSAAVTFHVVSGDPPKDIVAAALYGLDAALLV